MRLLRAFVLPPGTDCKVLRCTSNYPCSIATRFFMIVRNVSNVFCTKHKPTNDAHVDIGATFCSSGEFYSQSCVITKVLWDTLLKYEGSFGQAPRSRDLYPKDLGTPIILNHPVEIETRNVVHIPISNTNRGRSVNTAWCTGA